MSRCGRFKFFEAFGFFVVVVDIFRFHLCIWISCVDVSLALILAIFESGNLDSVNKRTLYVSHGAHIYSPQNIWHTEIELFGWMGTSRLKNAVWILNNWYASKWNVYITFHLKAVFMFAYRSQTHSNNVYNNSGNSSVVVAVAKAENDPPDVDNSLLCAQPFWWTYFVGGATSAVVFHSVVSYVHMEIFESYKTYMQIYRYACDTMLETLVCVLWLF